ncbi:amidohydrolase family protein [Microbacterium sp. SORGH_AS_0888]|uniref:amidohydrolase family protein n=1 Tax=Microbacterium sp. SORGH_AS_0888 TaxID=3041791 RepID=UPI00278670EA|nr:amidohydrolase family protein [Microbacterium sp. SORGH_AS_0888]MDQ1129723.1 aminocarboxymuconate-semialdehyde decarboxylase [Microbacterium sp. SORGH_AS_0888]
MIVDAHAHFLPAGYPEDAPSCFPHMEPIDGSTSRLLVFDQMRFPAKDVFFQAERRVEALEASGLDAEVVSPMPPLLRYDLPAGDGLSLARHVNDFGAEIGAYAPERIIALGMVPMQDPDAATAELAAIKERGLAGVEIASNILGSSIGDTRFLEFFREAERLDLPVFVHAMPSPMDRLPMSAMGTYVVGIEGMFAAASLILGGTAAACPDLRISFSHAAGGFPMMLPRANYFWGGAWNEGPVDEDRAVMHDDGPSPFEYARRFYYDAMVFDRRTIRYLVDLLGADRLLIGSDFPAMLREEPGGKTFREMELEPAQWADISHRNAFRWLGRETDELTVHTHAHAHAPA